MMNHQQFQQLEEEQDDIIIGGVEDNGGNSFKLLSTTCFQGFRKIYLKLIRLNTNTNGKNEI